MYLSMIDHIIYGTPDLESTIDDLEQLVGLRATVGGQHIGEGTRNALFSLGPMTYLEVIGPDSDQPQPSRPRWLGIDSLSEPRILTWAAKGTDLDTLAVEAAGRGLDLGKTLSGSRDRPDGSTLSWRLTDPRQIGAGGIIPFFIDWGESPHPGSSAVKGLQLVIFSAEHPEPERLSEKLDILCLDLPVNRAATPALIATLQTPKGTIELR
jgi:hypothetical protein